MTREVALGRMSEALANIDPAFVWDRRHPLHPTNRALTLEFAVIFLDLQADQDAYDIDLELFLVLFRRHR